MLRKWYKVKQQVCLKQETPHFQDLSLVIIGPPYLKVKRFTIMGQIQTTVLEERIGCMCLTSRADTSPCFPGTVPILAWESYALGTSPFPENRMVGYSAPSHIITKKSLDTEGKRMNICGVPSRSQELGFVLSVWWRSSLCHLEAGELSAKSSFSLCLDVSVYWVCSKEVTQIMTQKQWKFLSFPAVWNQGVCMVGSWWGLFLVVSSHGKGELWDTHPVHVGSTIITWQLYRDPPS